MRVEGEEERIFGHKRLGFVGNITVGSHLKKTIGSDLIRLELWEGHFGHGVENQLEGNLS